MEARPLEFGDILNRAVNLYARNFRVFVRIALVAMVPPALVEYATLRLERPQLDAMLAVWQHPEHLGTAAFPPMFDSPASIAMTIVSVLVGYVAMSFAVCAVAVATSDSYRDEPIGVSAAYLPVLARWPAILGVLGIALGVLIVCYAITIVVISIPLIVGAMFGAALPLIFTVVLLAGVAAIVFVLALILVTGAFAFFGVVVEGRGVQYSVPMAVSRIFTSAHFGRALLVSIAAAAVTVVPVGLLDTVTIFGFESSPAGYVALDAVVRSVMLPLSALILTVYYFDVRVRREGLDLEDAIFADGADDGGYAPTAYLSGPERALIKRFLERRDALTLQRRASIAAQLAQPVRERVPEGLRGLDDESLLERL